VDASYGVSATLSFALNSENTFQFADRTVLPLAALPLRGMSQAAEGSHASPSWPLVRGTQHDGSGIGRLEGVERYYVVPLHCSGGPFYEIMKTEMPTKLLRGFTDTEFVFDA
jgi:hypothetical protein